jgi:hypothetical protein
MSNYARFQNFLILDFIRWRYLMYDSRFYDCVNIFPQFDAFNYLFKTYI